MENWSLFLFDPSDPCQAISFASSATDMHWAQVWDEKPPRGANGEIQLIRVIRPLIWDNQFQGAIVIDARPESILSVRDLSLVINSYLHNREAQRTLSIQNERLSSNLALLQATQQSLVEARKIASLGHLLAGFSHEINTPLGVAITVTSFLESQVQDLAGTVANKDALAEPLESILESTALINSNLLRIRELIRQLQILAQRNDDDIPVDFRLAETVDFAVLVKKSQLQGKGISVTVEGAADVTINSLRNRLLVVINQLLDNAIAHAWPTENVGAIKFAIQPETDFITIHYRDNGVGLAPAIFKHLFEPFVTTARLDRHMGLGLHLIFLIVNHMLGGKIEIDESAKSGLSLIITLPRVFAGTTLQV